MNVDQGSVLMEDEGAGYLISVSDLMAGLLFVFIITLMAFVLSYQRAQVETVAAEELLKSEALQTAQERDRLRHERDRLQSERDRLNVVVDDLTNARRLRAEILERIQRELADLGIRVEVDTEHGILHLTEDAVHIQRNGFGKAVFEHAMTSVRQHLGADTDVSQEVRRLIELAKEDPPTETRFRYPRYRAALVESLLLPFAGGVNQTEARRLVEALDSEDVLEYLWTRSPSMARRLDAFLVGTDS